MNSCGWRTFVAAIVLPSLVTGVEIALGSRVRLLSDEASFREAFLRFPNDAVNGLSPEKLKRLGQEAEILAVYLDGTVGCKFDDGVQHDVPVEALSAAHAATLVVSADGDCRSLMLELKQAKARVAGLELALDECRGELQELQRNEDSAEQARPSRMVEPDTELGAGLELQSAAQSAKILLPTDGAIITNSLVTMKVSWVGGLVLVVAQDSDNQHSIVAISNKTDSVHMAETTIHSDFGSYTACICVAGQDIHECHFLAQPLNTCVSFFVTDGVVTESLYDDSYLPEIRDCPVLLEPVNATCLDSHSTPNQPDDNQGADDSQEIHLMRFFRCFPVDFSLHLDVRLTRLLSQSIIDKTWNMLAGYTVSKMSCASPQFLTWKIQLGLFLGKLSAPEVVAEVLQALTMCESSVALVRFAAHLVQSHRNTRGKLGLEECMEIVRFVHAARPQLLVTLTDPQMIASGPHAWIAQQASQLFQAHGRTEVWAALPRAQVHLATESLFYLGSWAPYEHISRSLDSPIWPAFLTCNEPVPITLMHMRLSLLPDRFSIVDVGANTGSYCLLPKALERAESFCFEVGEKAHALLSTNVRLNSLESRVLVFNLAVGDAEGCCTLVEHGGTHRPLGLGLTKVDCLSTSATCTKSAVRMIRLDLLLEEGKLGLDRCVKFLKVDAEGFDIKVLKGARKLIEACTPDILSEMTDDFPDFLHALGYKPSWLLDGEGGVQLFTVNPVLQLKEAGVCRSGANSSQSCYNCDWTRNQFCDR